MLKTRKKAESNTMQSLPLVWDDKPNEGRKTMVNLQSVMSSQPGHDETAEDAVNALLGGEETDNTAASSRTGRFGGSIPPTPMMTDKQPQQPTTPYGTPYGQGTPNQPYAPPQYGPSTNTPTNQVMPKTWLTESILATAASLLCCFNIVGIVTGVLAIFKANGVKSKFMKGDTAGANQDSASAKKWMMITIAVGVVWTLIQAYRMISNPTLLQQIQEGTVGSLYGL